MSLISRQEYLSKGTDLPFQDVPIPEMGEGKVGRIRVMGGDDRDRWDNALQEKRKDLTGLRAVLVAMCLIDESGKRLFSDKDFATVGRFNGIVLDRLYQAAWKLNKLGYKDLEDSAKNSSSEENESSGSSSPEQSSTSPSNGASDTLIPESSPSGRLISV